MDMNINMDMNMNVTGKNSVGIWNLSEPIHGYKNLVCKCTDGGKFVKAMAELTIPTGATVIRSFYSISHPDYLRTDMVKVDRILPINADHKIDVNYCLLNNSQNRSLYQEHQSYTSNLDYDVDRFPTLAEGIHFRLNRNGCDP